MCLMFECVGLERVAYGVSSNITSMRPPRSVASLLGDERDGGC